MANEIVRKGFVNKNGEKVQLLPAPHEHQISEVEGLNDALAGLSDSFEALDNGKQDKLTFDNTPTAGSTNPVTSSGVKAALDDKMPASYMPDRVECLEDAGRVVISLLESGSRGMVARIYIENAGEAELSAEINAANIPNLIRALTNPDSTPTDNSDNLVTSGGVKAALDGKANVSHAHTAIGDETTFINIEEGTINFEIYNESTGSGDAFDITTENSPNIRRALANPDSTPTADSDNLVTSGGVKAAVDAADAVHYKRQFYYGSASDKISVADLVSGHTYAVKVRVPTSFFSDVFAETGINFCGLEGSTPNVTTAIFRYFSLETDVEGSYEHFIIVLAYQTSSFEPI